MATDNKQTQQTEEIDRSGINFTSDADSTINSAALANQDLSNDELSLADAMQQNAFVLAVTRFVIKIKNHVSIIPLIMFIITMMIITFTIQVHVNATVLLGNDTMNSFWFFINVILSLLTVLLYININSKKTSRTKWIVCMVLLFLVIIGEIIIDALYMRDINIEINLVNSVNKVDLAKDTENYVLRSLAYTRTHMIFLIIDAVLAIAAPIVQPYTKQIRLHKKKKA